MLHQIMVRDEVEVLAVQVKLVQALLVDEAETE